MLNKVILVGRLAADPEIKATPKGMRIANLRVATNTYAGKDEAGNVREHVEFHSLVVFGRQAEIAGEYLRKGRLICAHGRLQTRSWEDGDGGKRRTTEVVVDNLQLLGPRPEEAA
jgi:single-strand DNA-binding protein